MKFPLLLAPFIAAFVIILMRTRYTKVWNKVRIPFLIVGGVLSAAVVCVMIGAAITMFYRDIFSLWEKILYCLVIVGMIGFFVWLNVSGWRKGKDGT